MQIILNILVVQSVISLLIAVLVGPSQGLAYMAGAVIGAVLIVAAALVVRTYRYMKRR